MTVRQLVWSKLENWAPLDALLVGGIHSGAGLIQTPATPFVIIRFNTQNREGFSDENVDPQRQYVTVWAHDKRSYVKIDEILDEAKKALAMANSENEVMEIRALETSPDLGDDGFGTICRFRRFLATTTR